MTPEEFMQKFLEKRKVGAFFSFACLFSMAWRSVRFSPLFFSCVIVEERKKKRYGICTQDIKLIICLTNHPRSHLTQVDVGRRMPNDVRPFHVGISRDSISQSEPRIYNATLIQTFRLCRNCT